MRIAALSLLVTLAACGGTKSEAPSVQAGSAGAPAGSSGKGGAGGSAGAATVQPTDGGDGGAEDVPSAGVGGRGGAGSGGETSIAGSPSVAGEGGEGGSAEETSAGAGGEPACVPLTSCGASCGSLDDGCGGFLICGCDGAHSCEAGACVVRPECDCSAHSVACSPLGAALGSAFACPVEVDCGSCPSGSFCAIPNNGPASHRACQTASESVCVAEPNPYPGVPAADCCAGEPAECSVPYQLCLPLVSETTGHVCRQCSGTSSSAWFCGPPL